ncbi:OmpA family protein [Nitrospiraceae bacterium AH_259_D15_M11_P09]|nr:OmpA family protein [Nitrospiraceae bacterium AH_259_D15_M11_P09]
MVAQSSYRFLSMLACMLLSLLLVNCASHTITTSVDEETFLPGPTVGTLSSLERIEPEAPMIEEATVELPSLPQQPTEAPVEEPPAEDPMVAETLALLMGTPEPPSPAPMVAAVEPAPAIEPIILTDVYFDFDRYEIGADAMTVLEANASQLNRLNGWKLVIEGHCDERGTAQYNHVLGEQRAQAVKRYLVDLGVPSHLIEMVSYGKDKPFCVGQGESCWQQNRRAHIVLQ